MGMTTGELYRTQPHLRTVVSFLARNIAQLPLHAYERASGTDRRRVTSGDLAAILSRPNPTQTMYELMYQTVSDIKLHDVALWTVVQTPDNPTGWDIRAVPPEWIIQKGGANGGFAPSWVTVSRPGTGVLTRFDKGQFIYFHGYNPGSPSSGTSPVESLKQILAEQIQAWSYRQQVWERGGRVGTYLTRPKDAPWSAEAREKFGRDWAAKWTGKDGPKAGGTPILEDGMTLSTLRFNAREEEWSEVAKLSLATVASVYHTSPTMVGILDNANYANVREFARMLYTDTLGPDIAMIEQRLNTFLLPIVKAPANTYLEFNIQAKLAGSFEEQAQILSSSVGGPWMSRNEARARLNMPRIDGGDDLIVPLNVITGGQASPRDSGSQNLNEGPELQAKARLPKSDPIRIKAEPSDDSVKLIEKALVKFFTRQGSTVLARLGAKDNEWWDEDRWNLELSDELMRASMTVTAQAAADALWALDLNPDDYDPDRTVEFQKALNTRRAEAMNAATLAQLKASLDSDIGDDAHKATPKGVFEEARTTRAESAAMTLATTYTNFGSNEAMVQQGGGGMVKEWTVTSANPRPSHAAMHGESTPVDSEFSNGMKWPGDIAGAGYDFDEVSNCQCQLTYVIP